MATVEVTTEADGIVKQLLTAPPADPYPLYDRLREIAPIHRASFADFWTLTRYDDLYKALRDPRFVYDANDQLRRQFGGEFDRDRPFVRSRFRWYANGNPPEYTKKRNLYGKAFTRFSVNELRPIIAAHADRLLDQAQARATLDVPNELGYELTVGLICHVLGLPSPEEGAAPFIAWFQAFAATFNPLVTEEMLAAADDAVERFSEYMTEHIERARRDPGDNLISRLLAAEIDGEHLTDDEVTANVVLVFNAGVSTTTNFIANSVFALLRNRDQWELLVSDPEGLAENAVEELLRYDSSITTNPPTRLAREDVEIGGVTIPAGEIMVPLFAAGNYDPSRYADPYRLDITRENVRPLSFGGGPHVCLGQHLARVEAEVALARLARRFPNLTLVDADPPRKVGVTNRGLQELHVRLH
jgi:cytochrome P450